MESRVSDPQLGRHTEYIPFHANQSQTGPFLGVDDQPCTFAALQWRVRLPNSCGADMQPATPACKRTNCRRRNCEREPSRSAAGGQSADRPRLGRKLRNANGQCRPASRNLDLRSVEDPDERLVQIATASLPVVAQVGWCA